MNTKKLSTIVFVLLSSFILLCAGVAFGQTSSLNVAPDGDVINTGWGNAPMFLCLETPAYGAISENKKEVTGQVSMQNPVANGTYTGVALTLRLKRTGETAEMVTVNIVVKGTPVLRQQINVNTDTFTDFTIVWDKLRFTKEEMASLEVFFKSGGGNKLSFDHLDCELTFVPSDPFAMVFPPRLSKMLLM